HNIEVMVSFQRGAWVRLYGIPLHAWNEFFFKLCVLDCGRYMRADSCTVEKDGLDYARILIATPALEVVKSVEKLLVEGELIEVKIIEEWGMALGEDACLFDDEPESETYQSDNEAEHGDPEASVNVGMLVDKIAEDMAVEMEEEEHTRLREKVDDKVKHKQPENVSRGEGRDNVALQNSSSASWVPASNVDPATQCDASTGECVTQILEPEELPISADKSTSVNPKKVMVIPSQASASGETKI
ncbi:sulfate transporter, partial [Trifolium medium]|nr:sulfate transporter [Trifolium medium]